ncbi:hypothetical protein [Lentzea sp. NBRC 105346]|uniref:hypothetical protein n=1 Tax=Lentzea sp. NBRC 105346 TaxID=3032205 RepID=UPI002553794A|nr:hypothetical protein [Lentzea sp. NBRC 105346]
MASSRACVLLLRAVTLGGLTAAAWLLSGAIAEASTDQPPAVEITAEPQLLQDPAGWALKLTDRVVEHKQNRKIAVLPPAPEQPADDGPALDYTSGSSGSTRTGSVSNQAPAPVIAAKLQANAARKAAKLAAAAPPPAPAPAPAPPVIQIKKAQPAPPAPPKQEQPADTGVDWTIPHPSGPMPSPQPAPASTAPSASSGHQDNTGGKHGVLAVLPSHSALFPPTRWTVEERTDGRSPGSLSERPGSSPD